MEEFLLYKTPLENGSIEINDSSWSTQLKQEPIESPPSVLESSHLFIHCDIPNESSNVEFHGFNSPPLTKLNLLLNFMKEIESGKKDVSFEEKDIIDGVEFLSFSNEQELMEYSKRQLEQRAAASQSDDGLEMLDDGTFSDISSNHAIIPTKTKDITRIKGWRNKHFAGIHLCDDSGSSLRNEDDGFGDDFEIKSEQGESSDDVESEDLQGSSVSKFDVESLSRSTFDNEMFDVSGLDDNNAVDNTEENGFYFRKSIRASSSESSCNYKTQNSHKSKSLDLSFNNKFNNNKSHITSEKKLNSEQTTAKKSSDSFLSPMAVIKSPPDKKLKLYSSENKIVYKPRVKLSLLESISRKLSSGVSNIVKDNDVPSRPPSTTPPEQGIRWRVPKEKLLLGNIYDLEVSLDCGERTETETKNENTSDKVQVADKKQTVQKVARNTNNGNVNTKFTNETINNNENKSAISAFQSTTLDHYTTNLDELHIDFTIPKLEAADAVTHEEIILPVPTNMPHRVKLKSEFKIKAKTVAEKRRLLAEMNKRTRLKQKLSNTLKASLEKINKYNLKAKESQLNQTKVKYNKTGKELKNNFEPVKQLFDERGVITCGRERPLMKRIGRQNLAIHKHSLIQSDKGNSNTYQRSNIGMIVNVGFQRPLYQEAYDNLCSVFGESSQITENLAAFAVSAVQPSVKGPFKVTRFLVKVDNENLKEFMHQSEEINTTSSASIEKINGKVSKIENLSEETNRFVKRNNIDPDIANVTNDILHYVESKECLESLVNQYDPDIPETIETEKSELIISNQNIKDNRKKKKTKLQRQIEILGGTFIAVQGEEGNEENLLEGNPEDKACLKDCCVMGCVCCVKPLKSEHCGKASCMFNCQCSIASKKEGCEIKSKIWLLPEVLRMQSTSQSKLAPIEKEYHHTVIMSKDKKTITIESKHKKRERKIPSKFKDEILDYSKTDLEDIVETDVIQDQKYICQNSKIPEEKLNDLKLPKSISKKDLTLMKQCHVKIYRENKIDRIVSPKPFIPGVFINKDVKSQSRNVATKKTAETSSHMFDTKQYCARTQGVTSYFINRNMMCKLRTKDFMMYAAKPHGLDVNDAFYNPDDNCAFIKEDLQLDVVGTEENESDWLERIPMEKESGPSIDFICSLPPEIFEKQDSTDLELSCANSQEIGSEPVKKKERIVYASLPATETECKWWVVELDSKKFSNLIYYSDKRCLYIDDMMRAVFKAEFGKKTVWIPLKKSLNVHQDKFGAYAVAGHKYLIFFGPYELRESHGLTAIKMTNNEDTFCRVYFSSKFSSSEKFKSLGITMPYIGEETPISAKYVKAVWWYSTGKKSAALQDKAQRVVEPTQNISGSWKPPVPSSPVDAEKSQEIVSIPNEESLCSTTDTFNEIEYDDSLTIKEEIKEEINIFDGVAEEQTINDIFAEETSVVPHEDSNYESNELVIDETASEEIKSETPATEDVVPSDISIQSEKPSAQLRTANRKRKRLLLSMKKKPKRAKRKFIRNKKSYNVKATPFKHNNNILRLQEKIAALNAAIGEENGNPNKIRDTKNLPVDSDSSSSFSDDDFYKEMDAEKNISPERLETANVNRIVHLPVKIPRSSEEEKKQGSLSNLMLKVPSTNPCPERALLCLTPGVGYLPVVEFGLNKLVIQDPANPSIEHQFQDQKQASLWLNEYFKKMFTFNENFDMEWSMVKGGLIRYLSPLGRSLFKFTQKELEITPAGLEPPLVMRQELRNQLERERRTEVNRLLANLSNEVLPPGTNKTPVQTILNSAIHMIKVQSIISKELDVEYNDLTQRKLCLNARLEEIFSESNSVEKEKESKIRTLIRDATNKSFKENMSDVYMKAMRDLEVNMVRSLEGFTKSRQINIQAEQMVTDSETMENINCQRTSPPQTVEHPIQPQSVNPIKKRRRKREDFKSSKIVKAIPTEGMLVKRKKRVNTQIPMAGSSSDKKAVTSRNSLTSCDVIDLVDSDEDKNQVIEIESDEEDVVWIPDQQPQRALAVDQGDVEIVSARKGILRKRQRLSLPKKNIATSIKPIQTPAFINLGDTVEEAFPPGSYRELDISGTITLSDPDDCSDDNQPAVSKVFGQAGLMEPEFVPVSDVYLPVSPVPVPEEENYSPFTSGCSRTDPVRLSNAWCRTAGSSTAPQPRPAVRQSNLVTCKSVTPIGKVPLNRADLNKFKGKRIMLYRSDSGFKMAKLPVSNSSLYSTVPQGMSVLKPGVGRTSNVAESIAPSVSCPTPTSSSPNLERLAPEGKVAADGSTTTDTVTLHHPSEEVCETRTVQFTPMNSVNVQSLALSGPKVRRPKSFSNLKVMFPKRS